jgi:DNA repair exonuclease SbcCD ATPase subunit
MNKIIDTRDLNERMEELQGLRDTLEAAKEKLAKVKEYDSPDTDSEDLEQAVEDAELDFGPDEAKELKELEELESEISEWRDGNTLIHESEFVDYCKGLCEDCGDVPRNIPHYIEINWDETAENIKADYSEVTYQGETYYVRS